VYKIKKPICYNFLDFSSLEKRKYYCEREWKLNRRFAKSIYLEVLPIRRSAEGFRIGAGRGEILDYAVKMRKMDPERRMDLLLGKGQVTPKDIIRLAAHIASFHASAEVITEKKVLEISEKFDDLGNERAFLNEFL